MFRSFIADENLSGGQPLSSQAAQGLPSAGLGSQESSWISALSRPPRFFLQKWTGRARTPALCDDWLSSMKTSFLCEENVFLRQVDDLTPVAHSASNAAQLQALFNGAAANAWPLPGSEELEAEVCRDQGTEGASSRTFFSRMWATCSEMNLAALRAWVPESRAGGARWWSSFWGGGGAPAQGLLSDVSHVQNLTGPHSRTKAAVFIQNRWILGESAGPTSHKGETFSAAALQTVQNMEGAPANHGQSGSGPGCVALDQDNGYSSLEEELFQASCLHVLTEALLSEAEGPTGPSKQGQEDVSEDAGLQGGEEDEKTRLDPAAQGERHPSPLPKCQNKAIAFIMGCPCSDDEDDDDDSSQSEGESTDGGDEDDDDDDGFDSEGSSSLSESSGDGGGSDSEVDLDTQRLWSSLCPPDPYNPQNFMAQLQTRTPPQTSSTPPPPQSDPTSQPPSDSWDDSASESDADEAERLRLWTSFSSCLDPYSPLNFQATLRTREPGQAGTGSRTREASRAHASPSQKEEPAERLDGDFRELGQSRRTIKKVSERP